MTESDRELIRHLSQGVKALQESVSDLHGVVARMDERTGLVFQRIEERQRRSSDRVQAVQDEAIVRERSILDAVKATQEDIEQHRAEMAMKLEPLNVAYVERRLTNKLVLWAAGGVGTVVGTVITALLVKAFGG